MGHQPHERPSRGRGERRLISPLLPLGEAVNRRVLVSEMFRRDMVKGAGSILGLVGSEPEGHDTNRLLLENTLNAAARRERMLNEATSIKALADLGYSPSEIRMFQHRKSQLDTDERGLTRDGLPGRAQPTQERNARVEQILQRHRLEALDPHEAAEIQLRIRHPRLAEITPTGGAKGESLGSETTPLHRALDTAMQLMTAEETAGQETDVAAAPFIGEPIETTLIAFGNHGLGQANGRWVQSLVSEPTLTPGDLERSIADNYEYYFRDGELTQGDGMILSETEAKQISQTHAGTEAENALERIHEFGAATADRAWFENLATDDRTALNTLNSITKAAT